MGFLSTIKTVGALDFLFSEGCERWSFDTAPVRKSGFVTLCQNLGRWMSCKPLMLWSHPPGSNRRPADYEEQFPPPNSPSALYGSAVYQQLGETAFAQPVTPDAPNRWGSDTVLPQPIRECSTKIRECSTK